MEEFHFVQSHPLHVFSEEDTTDYSKRDQYFIQSLKAMENMIDIDAYVIDYKNQKILYATKGSTLETDRHFERNEVVGLSHLDNLIADENLSMLSTIHFKVYDFMYSLPENRRRSGYFTIDYRIKTRSNKAVLINHKTSILDLTDDGALRLALCIISYPTSDKQGNAYIKMTDTNTVYEFMVASQKFVEVKTQKLTSKATKILELASNGKDRNQIAKELGISVNTVKYHKKKIFSQIGVKNTPEAIQWINNQKKLVKH